MYIRKTIDVWEVQGYFGNEWEMVTVEDTKKEALNRFKCYRENDRKHPYRFIKKRQKIEINNRRELK